MTVCEATEDCADGARKSYTTPSGELLVCPTHYDQLRHGERDPPPNTDADGRPAPSN